MRSDDKDKQWGTIYLGASNESTMEKLDAMQAASRREQMNQRTEQQYMEKVRIKATERAKEILGEAYTERQKVLDEAKEDAERLRMEMQGQFAFATSERDEAQQILAAAQEELRKAEAIREAAKDEGFTAGLEQAQQELEGFRAAMGASVAGVLHAIHAQNGVIFEGWRQEMVELLKVCVEKGTGLVLDEQYPLVLEQLVMEAVRQLDDRRCITLRVHPDDEAAVADMVAAARDRLPNIGQWIVASEPSLELGGLIAESQSGTVDSRLELHQQLVENILQHLVLPASSLDVEADRSVAEAVRQEAEKIAQLAPPLEAPALEPEVPPLNAMGEVNDLNEAALPPNEAASPAPDFTQAQAESLPPPAEMDMQPPLPETPLAAGLPPILPAEDILHVDDALAEAELQAQAMPHAEPSAPLAPQDDIPEAEFTVTDANIPGTADAEYIPPLAETVINLTPSRDELEQELFDLPDSPPSPQDDVLAQGGFLDSPHDGANKS